MTDYINIGGEAAATLITLAVTNFVFEADRKGLDIVRDMRDDEGNTPPLDEMISFVLCEEGRLLTA